MNKKTKKETDNPEVVAEPTTSEHISVPASEEPANEVAAKVTEGRIAYAQP